MTSWIRVVRRATQHPLNRHAKYRTVLRAVGWQLWKHLIRRPLSVAYWRGTRLVLDPAWPYASMVVYERLVEYDDLMFVDRILRPTDTFVDVGANIGMYTVLASARGGRVIAYEPHPATAGRLRANVAVNHLAGVTVRSVAVGDHRSRMPITNTFFDRNHIAGATDSALGSTVHIDVVTLDEDLPAGCAPTVLKIDTEGYELPCLRGARTLLKTRPPLVIVIELIGLGQRYGHDDTAVIDLLRINGYEAYRYFADRNELVRDSRFDPDRGNLIFLRDLPWALNRLGGGE